MDVVVKQSQKLYGLSESCKALKLCPWKDTETAPMIGNFNNGTYDAGLLPTTKDGFFRMDKGTKIQGSRFIRLRARLRSTKMNSTYSDPQYLAFSFGNTVEIDRAKSGTMPIGKAAENKLPVNVAALIYDKKYNMHDFVRIGLKGKAVSPEQKLVVGFFRPDKWSVMDGAKVPTQWRNRHMEFDIPYGEDVPQEGDDGSHAGPLELLNAQLRPIDDKAPEKPRLHTFYDDPSGPTDPTNPLPNSLQRFVNRELNERLFGEPIDTSQGQLVTRMAECVVGTGLVQIYLRVRARFLGARSDLRVETLVRFFEPPSLREGAYVTPEGNVWFVDEDLRLPYMARTVEVDPVTVPKDMLEELRASGATNPCPAGFPYVLSTYNGLVCTENPHIIKLDDNVCPAHYHNFKGNVCTSNPYNAAMGHCSYKGDIRPAESIRGLDIENHILYSPCEKKGYSTLATTLPSKDTSSFYGTVTERSFGSKTMKDLVGRVWESFYKDFEDDLASTDLLPDDRNLGLGLLCLGSTLGCPGDGDQNIPKIKRTVRGLLAQATNIFQKKNEPGTLLTFPEKAPKFRVYDRRGTLGGSGPKPPTDVWAVLWSESFNKMLLVRTGDRPDLMLFENFLHGALDGCSVNSQLFKTDADNLEGFRSAFAEDYCNTFVDNVNNPPKKANSGKGNGTDQPVGWYLNNDDGRYYFEGTFIDPFCNLSVAAVNDQQFGISTSNMPSQWQVDSMAKSAINYQILPDDELFKPASKGDYFGFGLSETEYTNENLIKNLNSMQTAELPTSVCKFFTQWNNQKSDACTKPQSYSLLENLMNEARTRKRFSDNATTYNCNILQILGNMSQTGSSNEVNVKNQCNIKANNLNATLTKTQEVGGLPPPPPPPRAEVAAPPPPRRGHKKQTSRRTGVVAAAGRRAWRSSWLLLLWRRCCCYGDDDASCSTRFRRGYARSPRRLAAAGAKDADDTDAPAQRPGRGRPRRKEGGAPGPCRPA